jgi:hypothetical protein
MAPSARLAPSGMRRRDVIEPDTRKEMTVPANAYHFISDWRVQGTTEEVFDTLSDATSLPRWWPSLYLRATELEPGDERGIGKVVDLDSRAWLPYTIRWRFRVTESDRPHHSRLEASGDLNGRGIWTITQEGEEVLARYDWKVRADKPLLRYLSPVLKPIFAANHEWSMARGEESLELELRRRRARSEAERAAVPQPPRSTPQAPFVAAAVAMVLIVVLVWAKLSREN